MKTSPYISNGFGFPAGKNRILNVYKDDSEIETIELELTQGLSCLIDAEDWDLVRNRRWYAVRKNRVSYVNSPVWDPDTKASGTLLLHRLIVGSYEMIDGKQIDHIDHNGLNNKRNNLRACSRSENQRNRGLTKDRRYKGIVYRKRERFFEAKIRYNGEVIQLGYYPTPEIAAAVYNDKAMELFGEYAYLNRVEVDGRELIL